MKPLRLLSLSTFLVLLLVIDPSSAYLRIKFLHWFPKYQSRWLASSEHCRPLLENYFNYIEVPGCLSPCACAADCLLDNLPGTVTSNLQSAQVLLGLIPAVLVFFGPSIAEVSVLSTRRPVLAGLLALGSPAVNVGRLFGVVDVREVMGRESSVGFKRWRGWLDGRGKWVKRGVGVLSYVGALAAIVNNVRNSVVLDLRTISGWRCGLLMMPLVWSLLGFVVHPFGIVGVRTRRWNGKGQNQGGRKNKKNRMRLKDVFKDAFCSDLYTELERSEATVLSEMLFWMGSLAAITHMVYGILDVASLVFIDALQAFEVFVLYATSATLCQLILLMELANMRYVPP